MNKLQRPGDILRLEFMEKYGLDISQLAFSMGVSYGRVKGVIDGRAITPDIACRLAKFFGNQPEYWIGLQSKYEIAVCLSDTHSTLHDIEPISSS